MIYFFNLQKKKKKNLIPVTQKPQRLQIAYIHGTSRFSSLNISYLFKTWIAHKNNFTCVRCRCVFKDEIESEDLSKFTWFKKKKKKKAKKKTQPVEVTNPYTHTRTHTNQTHTFLSICSWHDVGETRRICVMCRWAVAARPWFKEKQSFTSATNHVPRFTAGLRGSD